MIVSDRKGTAYLCIMQRKSKKNGVVFFTPPQLYFRTAFAVLFPRLHIIRARVGRATFPLFLLGKTYHG